MLKSRVGNEIHVLRHVSNFNNLLYSYRKKGNDFSEWYYFISFNVNINHGTSCTTVMWYAISRFEYISAEKG